MSTQPVMHANNVWVSFSSKAGQALEARKKLKSLAARSKGWKNGRGVPPSAAMVSRADSYLTLYVFLGIVEMDVFASEDGEPMVTAYADKMYVEANLEVDGSVTVLEEVAGEMGPEMKFASDADAFSWIHQRVKVSQSSREQDVCGLLGFSRSMTSIAGVVNLTTMLSKTPLMEPEYQFSANPARDTLAGRCVITSKRFTQNKQVVQRSFGNSMHQFSKTHLRQNKAALIQETTAI